jgi:hypothetical protein
MPAIFSKIFPIGIRYNDSPPSVSRQKQTEKLVEVFLKFVGENAPKNERSDLSQSLVHIGLFRNTVFHTSLLFSSVDHTTI